MWTQVQTIIQENLNFYEPQLFLKLKLKEAGQSKSNQIKLMNYKIRGSFKDEGRVQLFLPSKGMQS